VIRRRALALLLAAAHAAAAPVAAAQSVTQDSFEVHYAAFPTTGLPEETSRALGVRPQRGRALVLINVQKVQDGKRVPAAATGQGSAKSLTGHLQALRLRPAAQAGLHDAVADFEVLDGEWLTVELSVTPAGATRPIPVRFQQQFYLD